MLPSGEFRYKVSMIEHDGNRRVGLIGEKRGDGDDADEASCVGDGLEAIVALPSRMVEDGFCGRMIGGDGLPGNTARVQGRIMAAMARIDDDPDRIAAVDDIHAVERQSRIHTLGAADRKSKRLHSST